MTVCMGPTRLNTTGRFNLTDVAGYVLPPVRRSTWVRFRVEISLSLSLLFAFSLFDVVCTRKTWTKSTTRNSNVNARSSRVLLIYRVPCISRFLSPRCRRIKKRWRYSDCWKVFYWNTTTTLSCIRPEINRKIVYRINCSICSFRSPGNSIRVTFDRDILDRPRCRFNVIVAANVPFTAMGRRYSLFVSPGKGTRQRESATNRIIIVLAGGGFRPFTRTRPEHE